MPNAGFRPVVRSNADVAGAVIAHEDGVALRGAIASLDEPRQAVIAEHYFEGRSLRGVAEQLAVSPQRASQLHLSALGMLRVRLGVVA